MDFVLMCKNIQVYALSDETVLSEALIPGALKHGTLTFDEWLRTRYSVGSNVSARRRMLRAFSTDNHKATLPVTRALSLSDCYWLKGVDESVKFENVTPYLNKEWDGNGRFSGGSISTLFVNGAADKYWVNSTILKKVGSCKEADAYALCTALGLSHTATVSINGNDLDIENFTSTECFLESLEQSGFVGENDNHLEKSVDLFGEKAVGLLVADYLVEHDDRHSGNIGFLRNSNTGEYLSMAPYYDFDWIWTDGVTPIPGNAFKRYGKFIYELCEKAQKVAGEFERGNVISKRATELINIVEAI